MTKVSNEDLENALDTISRHLSGDIDIRVVNFESLPYSKKGYIIPEKDQFKCIQFPLWYFEHYGDNSVPKAVDEIRNRMVKYDYNALELSIANEEYSGIIGRFI